jgi:hypothetical protein
VPVLDVLLGVAAAASLLFISPVFIAKTGFDPGADWRVLALNLDNRTFGLRKRPSDRKPSVK